MPNLPDYETLIDPDSVPRRELLRLGAIANCDPDTVMRALLKTPLHARSKPRERAVRALVAEGLIRLGAAQP